MERINKKIYITGVAGMLGSNIAYLLKDKYMIYGTDRVKTDFSGVTTFSFDLLDFDTLFENLTLVNPDIIIHTAALVNVDGCEQNPTFAKLLNSELTKQISNYCKQHGAKMIYISTDAVFDGFINKLNSEDDKPNPINVYAETKLNGEKYVDLTTGLVLRTNIYGFNAQNKRSFGEWLLESFMNGDHLKMVTDVCFSPIIVNELTEIIDKCIDINLCGLFHACSSGAISKYDFGNYFKKKFGFKKGSIEAISVDDLELLAKRTKYMGMRNDKIKKALGIYISTPKEGIDRFYDLYNSGYRQRLKEWGKVYD